MGAIGNIFKSIGRGLTQGIPGTVQRYEHDAAEHKAAMDDLEFANHLQSIGAKPILHGLVREDVTAPDGSTAPVYRAPDPNRTKTTQKTAQGPVQWEVPSPDEQASNLISLNLKKLHQQFQGEADIRAQEGQEAATKAGQATTATGQAQQDLANRNRQANGVEAPQSLQEKFGNIFTEPAAAPAATNAGELPVTRSTAPAPAGVSPAAQLRQPRKFLPAELDPLMAGLTNSENVSQAVDAKQRTQAVQQLSTVVGNPQATQDDYDAVRKANPEATASWPKTYNPVMAASLIRQNVPVEKQPEYDIQTLTKHAMDSMAHDPASVDKEIDGIIPPTGDTKNLNARTKASVRLAISQGDLKGARALIKDSADKLSDEEKAVVVAKNTAPIKINIASAEAAARAGATEKASGLTEDDLEREGRQLAITGQSAQLGNGSGVIKAKILHYKNQFARDSGLSPKDIATAAAAYKGDAKSLAAMVTQRDQIGSFEKTAGKNLDLFLDAASKIPDTGIPWLNTPIRDLDAKIVGSTNMAAVNAAREVANNEIAKVTSGGGLGGVLSDAARNEVKSYNPNNATFAQTKAVATILRKDMSNRMSSFNSTIGDIEKRIANPGAQPTAETPAAAPAVAAGARKVGDTVTLKDGTTARITEILPNGKYKVE